jgi:hypothetical protein
MSDVSITPKIRCDNCGEISEKTKRDKLPPLDWVKPRAWGSLKIEGSRSTDSYGGKATLTFTDLCPKCAQSALDAAASVLKKLRGEDAHDD